MSADDALDGALKAGVQRGFNLARLKPRPTYKHPRALRRPQHALHEMRRDEIVRGARDDDVLVARDAGVLGREGASLFHRREDALLAGHGARDVAPRVEATRLLGERGQVRRLRGRQIRDRPVEIERTGARDAFHLIAVGRQLQISRQDLVLRQAALKPHREHRLARLGQHRARGRPALACLEQRHDLLADRRSALHHAPRSHVLRCGARDGDRVHAPVRSEAAVLGRERGRRHHRGDLPRRHPGSAHACGRPRLVQQLAVAIEHADRLGRRIGGQ